jgi:hypothetical protein
VQHKVAGKMTVHDGDEWLFWQLLAVGTGTRPFTRAHHATRNQSKGGRLEGGVLVCVDTIVLNTIVIESTDRRVARGERQR